MIRKLGVGLIVAAALLAPAGGVEAGGTTIYVPQDYTSIQIAIEAAEAGDTVSVSPGTYFERIDFASKAITVESQAGPELTIIDAQDSGPVAAFGPAEGLNSTLVGFTLTGGLNDFGFIPGGGVSIGFSSPSIIGNRIQGNRGCSGAGIGIASGSPIIHGNAITSNDGAGCQSGGVGGGGIGINGAPQARITENVISLNTSRVAGGGIALNGGLNTVIANNVITGNIVTDPVFDGDGGAISMINQSDVLIVQNLISKNQAPRGGGISWRTPSPTRGPYVINNTFVDNSADTGSAIFADGYDASALIANNILVAPANQTAIFCGDSNDLNPPMIRFNDAHSLGGSSYGGICPDQTGINGNQSVDPEFVHAGTGNYHLRPSSPAIDAGEDNAPDLPAFDLDDDGRVLDGNGDAIAHIDIGADEYDPSTDGDGDGMPSALDNCPTVLNFDQADLDGDETGDACDSDDDGDELDDVADNCPMAANMGQEDGDVDEWGDICDNCPTVPNPAGQADDVDGDLAGDACDAPGTGNVDCSGPADGVTSVDALKVLRHNAGLSVAQNEPCLDIGMPRALPPPDDRLMGDVDCSGVVNSVDALKILRAVAGLTVVLPAGCAEVKPP